MSSKLADVTSMVVNYDTLPKFIGKHVTIYGKVDTVNNNTLFLIPSEDSPDNKITVNNFGRQVENGSLVKIIGIANPDKSINCFESMILNNDFDLKLANQTATLMGKKDIIDYFL